MAVLGPSSCARVLLSLYMDELTFKQTSRPTVHCELMELRIAEHHIRDLTSRQELAILPRSQERPVETRVGNVRNVMKHALQSC